MMTFLVDCFYQQKEKNNSIKDEKLEDSDLFDFTDDLKSVLPASKADLTFVQKDYSQLNSTIEKLKSYLPQALKDMTDNDNYYSKFNEFQEKHLDEVHSIKEKISHVDDLYKKTVKLFNEDPEKITCQDFLNIFAKFVVDYEVEKKEFLEMKEKEEKIKTQNMKKVQIEELSRIMSQEQNTKNVQSQDKENLSQRGIIDNMLKTINQTSIQNDDTINNETIIKKVQSKRSERIKRLLNKNK